MDTSNMAAFIIAGRMTPASPHEYAEGAVAHLESFLDVDS